QKNSTYIALTQPWAEGLIARPIDTAIASGLMRDEQAKFNVNNLIDTNGKRRDVDAGVLVHLLTILKLDPGIANAIVDWLDADDDVSSPGGAENDYYWSQRPAWRAPNRAIFSIDELRRVKGVNDKVFATLSPFITALPRPLPSSGERTKININTSSVEILQAVLSTAAPDEISEIIRLRELPFTDATDIKTRRPRLSPTVVDTFLDVNSRYFEAALAITGESAQMRQSALLQLQSPSQGSAASIWPAIIWVKEQ
ncbi:MAG: type II secretion system minor pseudopilin GspK, partial [Pseudomonadota bacterium]